MAFTSRKTARSRQSAAQLNRMVPPATEVSSNAPHVALFSVAWQWNLSPTAVDVGVGWGRVLHTTKAAAEPWRVAT